jgi:crossover junction endodeoxyribonuclease RuvC
MKFAQQRNDGFSSAGERKKVRVLGVDPAAAGPTGYGVVETDGRACRTLLFGALSGRPGEFPHRLREIHELICELIDSFSPESMAVESVFTALNMRTALKLAEVRGVVVLAAAQSNIPVHSYSPREVKASVAGYGQASKHQMQLMVRALLDMNETPEPADAADALAVALCHIQASKALARLAAPQAGLARAVARSRSGAARIPAIR